MHVMLSIHRGQSPEAVLFDVDGTLVDNSYLHTVAWWRACRDLDQLVPMATLHRLVGMGADRFIDALFHREWSELADAHSAHIAPFFEEMVAFPRAADLLRAVGARGQRVVFASSASDAELRRLRSIVGADDALCELVSSSDAGESKPAPDIFQVALRKVGIHADRAIAVGDTGWDVEAARRSGLGCIGLLSGGWSREELDRAGAVAVYRDVAELFEDLERSPISNGAG
jgi:HAD superfamily hydrolase (TIGR01549 family)